MEKKKRYSLPQQQENITSPTRLAAIRRTIKLLLKLIPGEDDRVVIASGALFYEALHGVLKTGVEFRFALLSTLHYQVFKEEKKLNKYNIHLHTLISQTQVLKVISQLDKYTDKKDPCKYLNIPHTLGSSYNFYSNYPFVIHKSLLIKMIVGTLPFKTIKVLIVILRNTQGFYRYVSYGTKLQGLSLNRLETATGLTKKRDLLDSIEILKDKEILDDYLDEKYFVVNDSLILPRHIQDNIYDTEDLAIRKLEKEETVKDYQNKTLSEDSTNGESK